MKNFSVYLLCLDSSKKTKKVFTGEVVKGESSDYFRGDITEEGNNENTLNIFGKFDLVTTFSYAFGPQRVEFLIGAKKEPILGGYACLGLMGKYGVVGTDHLTYNDVVAAFREKTIQT